MPALVPDRFSDWSLPEVFESSTLRLHEGTSSSIRIPVCLAGQVSAKVISDAILREITARNLTFAPRLPPVRTAVTHDIPGLIVPARFTAETAVEERIRLG